MYTKDGQFDSLREYNRWKELKLAEQAGAIYDLQRQVPFVLIPKQKDPNTGKVLERQCTYIADFVYMDHGFQIVEDAKGCKTEVYKIKKKLMLERYGLVIQEV